MALTIEDGSVVPGADSFALASELVTYAANFGRTIPATEGAQESLLRRAYLQMIALPWKGGAVSPDQTGAWPRYDVKRDKWLVASDIIPAQIKAGQMALATEIHADDLVDPETKTGAVTKERVEGAVEVQYSPASARASKPAATRQSYAQFAGFLESSSQVQLVRG
ncbi:MAG TPA: DnaT-like ssDNA-binding protein [Pseudomonas sp.]|nr:DnaT-like ssDNA-binding protein [Pseudomonas sp.]